MRALLLACALSVLAVVTAARASAQALTIASSHTLTADVVVTSGTAIQVNGDYLVLNLNGKTVRCAPSNPGTAVTFGVSAGSRSNVTIKNGSITGCFFGVYAGYATGIVLEDVNLSGNTYIGAHLGYGVSNAVRRVTCNQIGGYTVEAYAICVNGIGDYGLVEDSAFTNVYRQTGATGTGEGVGVLLEQGAQYVIVRRNTFTNAELRPSTMGMWSANGSAVTVSHNTFTRLSTAMAGVGYTDGGGNVITADPLPPPPPPPLPAAPETKWFRVCVVESTLTVCYEGLLTKAP